MIASFICLNSDAKYCLLIVFLFSRESIRIMLSECQKKEAITLPTDVACLIFFRVEKQTVSTACFEPMMQVCGSELRFHVDLLIYCGNS